MKKINTFTKGIRYILAIFAMAAIPAMGLAQTDDNPEPLGKSTKVNIVNSIAGAYNDWSKVSLSGKLSSPLLPVTATVKVYMEKGKQALISVSAPLIGEAARIEIDNDGVLVVNKIKKTYATIEMSELQTLYPGTLEEIQALLLGRVALLGKGQLTKKDADCVELYQASPGSLMLLPTERYQQPGAVYFYTIDTTGLSMTKFLLISEDGSSETAWDYRRAKTSFSIDIAAVFDGTQMAATLDFNAPDFNPKPLERFDIPGSYKPVSPSHILRM